VRIEPPRPPGHPVDEAARLRLHLALVVAETAVDPVAAWRALDLWPDGAALVARAEREVLAATDRRARRAPATAIGAGAFLPDGDTAPLGARIAEAQATFAAELATDRAVPALPVVAPLLDEVATARPDLARAATLLRSRFDPGCWEWTMTMLAFNGEAWVPPLPFDDDALVGLAQLTRVLPRWRAATTPSPARARRSRAPGGTRRPRRWRWGAGSCRRCARASRPAGTTASSGPTARCSSTAAPPATSTPTASPAPSWRGPRADAPAERRQSRSRSSST
jgi:hypothetical protein